MKAQHIFFLLLFSSLLLNSKCRKEPTEPQLPPETTTGAMTFGCKIDGKVFVPKGSFAGPALDAQYLFLGNGLGGGWFLNVGAANRIDNPNTDIAIATDSLILLEGISYPLKKMKGSAYGQFGSGILFYQMGVNDTGALFITKHDQTQRILSGRFSFTASRLTGEKVKITDGRFDIRY
jgi:hypothetical protein